MTRDTWERLETRTNTLHLQTSERVVDLPDGHRLTFSCKCERRVFMLETAIKHIYDRAMTLPVCSVPAYELHKCGLCGAPVESSEPFFYRTTQNPLDTPQHIA